MEKLKWATRGHVIYMTDVDAAAFSRVLREVYPTILFIDDGSLPTPGSRLLNSIEQSQGIITTVYLAPEHWTPEEEAQLVWKDDPRAPLPRPSFRYLRSRWNFSTLHNAMIAWDPPTLDDGLIQTACRSDDVARLEFTKNIHRLIRKVTVNSFSSGYAHFKPGEADFRGAPYRAGHDALRWCSAAPRRMLGGKFRPHSKWRFPDDNPYYKGLGIFGRPEDLCEQLDC